MKALVLLSHGSRRREATEEMASLAGQVGALPHNPYGRVVCAFQQFAAPSFQKSVDDLVSGGVTDIDVLPLFLAAGSHVLVDVPAMIRAAERRYPHVRIAVAPHLGGSRNFARFLLDQAVQINRGADDNEPH